MPESDLQLRVYALETARAIEGPKATTDEVLQAADEIFYWLRHGVFGVDGAGAAAS